MNQQQQPAGDATPPKAVPAVKVNAPRTAHVPFSAANLLRKGRAGNFRAPNAPNLRRGPKRYI